MKKKYITCLLMICLIVCLSLCIFACSSDNDDDGRVNPHIIIETDVFEVALDEYDTGSYRIPYAGIYYDNLDRVDGIEITASLIDEHNTAIYENESDYTNLIRIPGFVGKYSLVYKANGCNDAVITIYVCKRIIVDQNFTLNGNTLSWQEAYGAIGYDITINGQSSVFVEKPSFTSEIFSQQGFYVGITAKGDNKNFIDSHMVSYENRIPLKQGELAAFNNPCYELDIKEASPSQYNAAPSEIKYLSKEECAGSTDGAIKFKMISGEYGTGLFRLDLQNKINLDDDFDGIEIRFKLDSTAYIWQEDQDPTRLIIAQPDADERRITRGIELKECYNNNWQIIKLPKNTLDRFNNLKYLQFSLYNMTRSGGKGVLYFDYIRLYKDELQAPQNVSISGENLVWSSVDNISEYMISVDVSNEEFTSKYYYSSQNQIGLSQIGIDTNNSTQQYRIKVRGISNITNVGSSAWSEILEKKNNTSNNILTPLNDEIYTFDIENTILDNGKVSFNHLYWKEYGLSVGAEDNKAIRIALYANGTYGTYSCFTVNLQKPLDFSGENGTVLLRYKVESSNYANNETLGVQIIGSEKSADNLKGNNFRQLVRVGEWMEYQCSFDDLKSYYKDGDTQLSFMFINTEANKSGSSVYLVVALDYICVKDSLPVPTNVHIVNNKLVWNAVSGADSYTVNANGEEITNIKNTEFDISSYNSVSVFKVLAHSAMNNVISSSYSEEVYYEELTDNLIASFDHIGYVNKVKNVAGIKWGNETSDLTWKEAPFYDNGTVKFGVFADNYNFEQKPTNLCAFSVGLAKELDLTKGGIIVKIKIYKQSNENVLPIAISILPKNGNSSWNILDYTNISYEPISVIGEWIELTVSSNDLQELGYVSNDEELYFGIWQNSSNMAWNGYSQYVQIDFIKQYETSGKLNAPQTLTISNSNLLTWDAIQGASSYRIVINDKVYYCESNEYDISSYTEDLNVKIMAISNNLEIANSLYSKEFVICYDENIFVWDFN